MSRIKYKNADERKEARNAQIQRYKAEKTKEIRANLPPVYAEKLEYIAQRLNTSKAGVLKTLIEREFERLKDE